MNAYMGVCKRVFHPQVTTCHLRKGLKLGSAHLHFLSNYVYCANANVCFNVLFKSVELQKDAISVLSQSDIH